MGGHIKTAIVVRGTRVSGCANKLKLISFAPVRGGSGGGAKKTNKTFILFAADFGLRRLESKLARDMM